METRTQVLLYGNVFNDRFTQYRCSVLLTRSLFRIDLHTFSSSCRQSQGETEVSDSSDQDEVEVIGEKLFGLVRDIEPTLCADITGECVGGLYH